MTTIIEQLAQFTTGLRLESLPSGVVQAARRVLLDTLASIIAGAQEPAATAARHAHDGLSNSGSSTVLLWKDGDTQAEVAALCNGIAAHSIELDDFHRASTIHPGAVVIPAALAMGQEKKIDGARLLESVIAGYEVMIRLGLAARGSLYARSFHPTATIGVFGAAAAAAHVMGLDPIQTTHALALAGTRASGLLAYKVRGDWSKRLQAGNAAAQGLNSARFAAAGFLGPVEIFEGQYGFLSAYASGDLCPEDAVRDLGTVFHLDEISFKPYASCRFTHAPIDALLSAMREGKVQADEIRQVEVAVHAQAVASVMVPAGRKYRPQTPVDAQFSLPYCLAVAAQDGQVRPESFQPQALADPITLELASRMVVSEDPAYTALFPKHNAARVALHTDRGTFANEVFDARGDPEYPLSDDDLTAKFIALTQGPLGGEATAKSLSSIIWQIDKQPSLESLANHRSRVS